MLLLFHEDPSHHRGQRLQTSLKLDSTHLFQLLIHFHVAHNICHFNCCFMFCYVIVGIVLCCTVTLSVPKGAYKLNELWNVLLWSSFELREPVSSQVLLCGACSIDQLVGIRLEIHWLWLFLMYSLVNTSLTSPTLANAMLGNTKRIPTSCFF